MIVVDWIIRQSPIICLFLISGPLPVPFFSLCLFFFFYVCSFLFCSVLSPPYALPAPFSSALSPPCARHFLFLHPPCMADRKCRPSSLFRMRSCVRHLCCRSFRPPSSFFFRLSTFLSPKICIYQKKAVSLCIFSKKCAFLLHIPIFFTTFVPELVRD